MDIRVKYCHLPSFSRPCYRSSELCMQIPTGGSGTSDTSGCFWSHSFSMINTQKTQNWHKLRNLRIKLFFFPFLSQKTSKKKSLHSVIFLFICLEAILWKLRSFLKFVTNGFYLCYLKCAVVQYGKEPIFSQMVLILYESWRKSGVFILHFCIRCTNFLTGKDDFFDVNEK